MSEDDFIALYSSFTFDDVLPGAYKTFGELTFEDSIDMRVFLWTARTLESVSWTNRSLP